MSGAGIDASESIVHRSSGTLPLKHLQRYGLAVISVAVALGAALLLQRFHFGDVVVPLLLFAGAISSWYGGPGPAVLTVLLSLMGFAYFFVPPIYSLRVAPSELPYFIISAALTSLISWFATIRRRVEEAARRSETELRQLIDVIPQQVQVFDAHWNPVFANRREREYTGLTLEEARSKDALARILHPEDREKLDAIHQRALLQPAPFELEARIMGKDGLYRWFLIQENPLRDERGRVLRWYVTRTDIEDRKRAADTLRQTEAILSQAQRIARIGVWVTRPPMIPEYWSATAFEIFGIDPADGPPQDLQEFMLHVHPDDRERVMRETDVLETGRVFECKYRILRPDGTTRVIREVGSPVQESGAVQHFVGAWMDIPTKKRRRGSFSVAKRQCETASSDGKPSSRITRPCTSWSMAGARSSQ